MPDNFTTAEVEELLAQQGYTRMHRARTALEVIQDRVRLPRRSAPGWSRHWRRRYVTAAAR